LIKEITVTKDDYKAYSKFACSKLTPPREKGLIPFFKNLAVWLVVTVVFFTIFQTTDFSVSKLHWPTALATSLPFLIFIFVFIGNLKKIERNSTPNENGLMLGKRIIEINDSGITDSNSLGTCTYSWHALQEVVVHEGNVYLFLDTMLAQIIPYSTFVNKDEAEEFAKNIDKLHNRVARGV